MPNGHARVRFGDYTTTTRSTSFGDDSSTTADIMDAVTFLHRSVASEVEERGITLVGVTVSRLAELSSTQPALPLIWAGEHANSSDEVWRAQRVGPAHVDRNALDVSLDAVRARFGAGAVVRGVNLWCNPTRSGPWQPD